VRLRWGGSRGRRFKIDFRGHVIARFERGKIVEEFEVFDELAMLRQMGVVDAEDLLA